MADNSNTEAAQRDFGNFDIAISYVTRDGKTAEDLYARLAVQYSVFLYPKHQEQLSGRDGMEQLRQVFLGTKRMVVILYRKEWGDTAWTAVERDAIKDHALKAKGWDSVLMVTMDDSEIPNWYPATIIRYRYEDYGLEQLVGVIKSKMQELGLATKKPSALLKAALLGQEMDYRRRRQQLLESTEGVNAVRAEFDALAKHVVRKLDEIRAQNPQIDFRFGADSRVFAISSRVSLQGVWIPQYANRVPPLQVLWTNIPIALPGQRSLFPENADKYQLAKWTIAPELTSDYQWVWAPSTHPDQRLTTEELAEFLLQEFLELLHKRESGSLQAPRESPYG